MSGSRLFAQIILLLVSIVLVLLFKNTWALLVFSGGALYGIARSVALRPNCDEEPEDGLLKEAPRFGRIIEPAVGIIAVALAVVTVWSVPRPTGDLYVALAAGRDIMEGKLNKVDDWSFSTNNEHERRVWVNQNWGTHLLYYGFYKAFGGRDGDKAADTQPGEAGLLLLKFLIIAVGTICLVLALRRRGSGWPVALLVAAGIIAAGRSFIDLRPNLTTLMFVPVMLHVLFWTGEKPHRSWVAMVVFGLVWANLHGGYIFGLFVMGGWAMSLMLPPLVTRGSLRLFGPGLLGAAMAGIMTVSASVLLETLELGKAQPGMAKLAVVHFVLCVLIYIPVVLIGRLLKGGDPQRAAGWQTAAATAALFTTAAIALAVAGGAKGEGLVPAVVSAVLIGLAFLAGHGLATTMKDLGGKGGLLAVGALAVVATVGSAMAGLAVAVGGLLAWAIVMNLLARQKTEPELPRPVVRRTWPYLAATLGGFVLAGIFTPFGLHNLGRTDTTLPFGEMWNLTHWLVVARSADSSLWQQVIEWHSIFTPGTENMTVSTFGTSWEFFTILGIFAALLPLRVAWKLRSRRPLNIADAVLLTATIAFCVAVAARAWPVYQIMESTQEFASYTEQLNAWMAAVIVFAALAFFAGAVAIFAAGTTWRRWKEEGEGVETLSAREVGLLIFEVVWAVFGVLMAFNSRRFIPVGLVLCAPLVARELRWLLGDLPRIFLEWQKVPQGGARPAGGQSSAAPAAVATDLASQVLKAMPFTIVAVLVIMVISVQAKQNLLTYLPGNPLNKEGSVLKDMIVYRMFPPGPKNFILANGLKGRVFNEWRWEGYLHWYCPELSLFLGGRAQQAYSAETYRLQKDILSGAMDTKVLEQPDMKIDWVVVPVNGNYDVFLRQFMTSSQARWAPIYYDGENFVLANPNTPVGAEAVQRCLDGKLKYPGEVDANSAAPAVAQLSRAQAMLSRLTNVPKEQAVAAAKESIRSRPTLAGYATLGEAYQAAKVPLQSEREYLQSEARRLANMDWRVPGGFQILSCRQWVLDTLMGVYGNAYNDKMREATSLERQFQDAVVSGRDAEKLRKEVADLRSQLGGIAQAYDDANSQRMEALELRMGVLKAWTAR